VEVAEAPVKHSQIREEVEDLELIVRKLEEEKAAIESEN
jgi:hypothetical protein